jgi:hypothetical protein
MTQIKPSTVKPQIQSKPSRKSSLLLKLGGAGLVVGAGATAYWLLVLNPSWQAALPVGVNVIPPSALMTLSVSTEPQQWQQLRSLGTPQSRTLLDQNLVQLRDRLLTANGLNYEQNIQPWVGKEAMIAFLPSTAPTATAGSGATTVPGFARQGMLTVLPIANPAQALQALQKLPAQQANQWQERKYEGFPIQERQGSIPLAVTLLDHQFVVVSTEPKLIEQAIDTYKKRVSLANMPGYQQAWSTIQTEQPFAKIFVNVPVAAAAIGSGGNSPVSADSLMQRQQNQGLATTVSLEATGLQFQGISWLRSDSSRRLVVENTAQPMPKRLPAETYMMLSGGSLKQLWQDYEQGAQGNPIAPLAPERLRDGLKSLTGLEFERDFLGWTGKEFALAVIPAPADAARQSGVGLAFLVKASDRRGGESFLQRLDQAISDRYKLQVKPSAINGQTATDWIDQQGRWTATHGWLEGDVAFLVVGAPIAKLLLPNPQNSLATSQLFQTAVPTNLKPNNGHFFLNVDQTVNLPMPDLPFLQSANPLVRAIRTIGVTAAIRDVHSTRFNVGLQVQKTGQPQPLPAPNLPSPAPATPDQH